MELLNSYISSFTGFLWDYIIIILLIGAGIWFSFSTKFIQIRELKEMVRLLGEGVGKKTEGNRISSFQAFCVSSASRVGVGNIAGIAIAVVLGGPGAVFWMWFIAFLGAATGFIESTLAQIYKEPSKKGGFHGGPAYYIKAGLKSPVFAFLFAVLISVTYGLIYNSVQANTLAMSMQVFSLSNQWIGIIVALLTAVVIFGGVARIAKVSEWLVPIMAGIYILTAVIITLIHIDALPGIFYRIFTEAFSFDAATGGFFGAAMMNGIKRGLFSNEAGEGSVPNAAATADVSHPVKQGLIQSFGVFVDTFLVCSASAFIVLVSGNYETAGMTGIELVQHDLSFQLGSWAPSVMAIFIFMFAFSSIVGNYYYGEINIAHLTKNPLYLNIFRVLVVFMVYFGSIASLDLVWNLADLFMAFMVLTNVTSIILLGKQAIIAMNDYFKQKKAGVLEPVFHRSTLPNTDGIVWWHEGAKHPDQPSNDFHDPSGVSAKDLDSMAQKMHK
ncbi:MAG: alanine:cation symporter family protein [Veillonella sp.]|uniref:alanine/glycine:cation symporter family protein n=1 Tax=Veillonella sp. TaxID=1926307 RepID=UPI0025CB97A8|nr:alanine/glycine:cation symporter family protein [Veillonella sp.]MBS4913126.1 alanine:cation symporter family protein [Veillonella sp.]